MKLLLVEDEELTRTGLKRIIPWETLGIHEVKTAVDGMEGLQSARTYLPDIVLADVRMPQMTGIEMAFAIREKIKYCKFIFMSGYCDKEYLKSAIRLSAINYIEKPIEISEVIDSLKGAVAQLKKEQERVKLEAEYRSKLKLIMEDEPEENLVPATWQSSQDLANQIDQYIHSNCLDNDLSLTVLAEHFHLTKQYLCWIFKKEKHTTINQSMIRYRIQWASNYIMEHPLFKTKELAELAGFTDSNYFIKIFKKYTRMTPMEYREKI